MRGGKTWPSLRNRGVSLAPCTRRGCGQCPGLQPCEQGAGGVGRSAPRGRQGLGGSQPPPSGVFPPLGPGMSASTGAWGGTRCRQCLRHVLFNPNNPKSPGGSGAAGDAFLQEQTSAVLLVLYLKCSPGHSCLTDGFSRLHKAFLRAPAPSLSQNSPIRVRNCCKPKAEAWHFLPKLSPPFRWEPARSVTQVANFLLNNGSPL